MRRIKFRKPYKLKNYRFGLVALVLVLSIIGILVVGSANESYQSKQIFGVVIGLVVMAIVSLIDYVWITNFYWILYGMSVFMLANCTDSGNRSPCKRSKKMDQSWFY